MTGVDTCMVLKTHSPEETIQVGKHLALGLAPGDVIALSGELGSGKTCLTQGIAIGLGVPDHYAVTSPTFTLINEYPGDKLRLFHMDAYRLAGCGDLEDTGYDEYLVERGVMVIEWAERINPAIPSGALFIFMTYVEEWTRNIEISGDPQKIHTLREILKQ
jgi:tRNA threonylcarbamoyladenosine biosynthesis protein TsaE